MWRSEKLLRYRAANSAACDCFLIRPCRLAPFATFSIRDMGRRRRSRVICKYCKQYWRRNESASSHQYQLTFLDDSNPTTNALLYLELWRENDKNEERRHGMVCKMRLNNASSWSDLKKFILSCNCAVMAKEIDEREREDIETGTSISRKVLADAMRVSERNIAYMHQPGTESKGTFHKSRASRLTLPRENRAASHFFAPSRAEQISPRSVRLVSHSASS